MAAIHLGGNVERKAEMESNASWVEHSVCTEWAWIDLAFGTASRWWSGLKVGWVGASYSFPAAYAERDVESSLCTHLTDGVLTSGQGQGGN